MTESPESIVPVGIKLHSKSRLLEIAFSDDTNFMYPCEYLRISAPGEAGGAVSGPVHGKQTVEIRQLEPQGTESLRLEFDDGYTTSFSWQVLHELATNYDQNWQDYLVTLEKHGLERSVARATGADGRVTIKLLYFVQLARLTGRDEEDVEIPDSVTNVETLLAWLCRRRQEWGEAFLPERVQVTVNRHFAEPFTLIEHGDEVAIVPRA